MENAGKDGIPDEAERKGLGTPATRAAIIEKLVAAGFVERKGKSLIPTKAGIVGQFPYAFTIRKNLRLLDIIFAILVAEHLR